jgi:hypothetical protein
MKNPRRYRRAVRDCVAQSHVTRQRRRIGSQLLERKWMSCPNSSGRLAAVTFQQPAKLRLATNLGQGNRGRLRGQLPSPLAFWSNQQFIFDSLVRSLLVIVRQPRFGAFKLRRRASACATNQGRERTSARSTRGQTETNPARRTPTETTAIGWGTRY